MITKNILDIFVNTKEDRNYLRVTKDRKSYIVHIQIDEDKKNEVICHQVFLKEATVKDGVKNKEQKIKNMIEKNPNRIFLEPNGKTLGIIAHQTKPMTLPGHIDDYAFMTPKECFDWLLLRSIGL